MLPKASHIIFIRNIRKNFLNSLLNIAGSGFLLLVLFVFILHILFQISYETGNENKDLIYRLETGNFAVSSATISKSFTTNIPEISSVTRIYPASSTVRYDKNNYQFDNIFFTDSTIYNTFNINFVNKNDRLINYPFSIVLTENKANLLFGETNPLNKTVLIDKREYIVSGIIKDIPENSHLHNVDAFIPFTTLKRIKSSDKSFFNQYYFYTYLLVKPQTNVDELTEKINKQYKDYLPQNNPGLSFLKLNPLTSIRFSKHSEFDFVKHSDFKILLVSIAVATLILFLIIFNNIIYSMARNLGRLKEYFIKYSLGMSGADFFISSVLESLFVYSVCFVFSALLFQVLKPFISVYYNIETDSITVTNLFYLYGLVVLLSVITGVSQYLFIFIKITRLSAIVSFKIKMKFFKQFLFFIQFMITAVLIIFTLHLNKQINYIFNYDLGFNPNNIVFFKITGKNEEQISQLKEKLLQIPSVKIVSCSNSIPGKSFMKRILTINGDKDVYYSLLIDNDFIQTYQLKHSTLSDFNFNNSSNKKSFMINRTGLKRFPGINYSELRINEMKCIGVIDDFNFMSLHSKVQPLIIFFEPAKNSYISIKLTSESNNQLYESIKRIYGELYPDEMINIKSFKVFLSDLYKKEIFQKRLLFTMTTFSLIISILGLLSLSKIIVTEKSKEIGIRKILGAGSYSILWTILSKFIFIMVLASIISIPVCVFLLNSWLSYFPYNTGISLFYIIASLLVSISLGSLIIIQKSLSAARSNPADLIYDR